MRFGVTGGPRDEGEGEVELRALVDVSGYDRECWYDRYEGGSLVKLLWVCCVLLLGNVAMAGGVVGPFRVPDSEGGRDRWRDLERFDGELVFDGLQLDVDDARTLAARRVARIRLTRVRELRVDAALELSAYLGDELVLEAVERLDGRALQALGQGAFARNHPGPPGRRRLLSVRAPVLTHLDAPKHARGLLPRLHLHAPALEHLVGVPDGVRLHLPADTALRPQLFDALSGSAADLVIEGVEALTPEQRAALPAPHMEPVGTLPPAHLEKYGPRTVLPHTTLDEQEAKRISGFSIAGVTFPDLKRIERDAAYRLANWGAAHILELPALEDLDQETANALRGIGVMSEYASLTLGGFEVLDAEVAGWFDESRVGALTFPAVKRVEPGGVRGMMGWGEDVLMAWDRGRTPSCLLALPAVETLTVEVAQALAEHPCSLDLGGVRDLSPAAVRALAKHRGGDLHLRRLPLTPERAEQFLRHPGLVHPGATEPISEAVMRHLARQDVDRVEIAAAVDLTPEALDALLRTNATSLTINLKDPDPEMLSRLFAAPVDHLDVRIATWSEAQFQALKTFRGRRLALRGDVPRLPLADVLHGWEGDSLMVERGYSGPHVQVRSLGIGRRGRTSPLWKFKGERLDLSAVVEVSGPVDLASLAQWPGRELDLSGLQSLDDATADGLAAWEGEQLDLSGLSSITGWQLRRLREAKAHVRFPDPMPPVREEAWPLDPEGMRGLSAEEAARLATGAGDVLTLDGVEVLSADAAFELLAFEGATLRFPDLRVLDEEAAWYLFGTTATTLEMPALEVPDAAAFEHLDRWAAAAAGRGPLTLRLDAVRELEPSWITRPLGRHVDVHLPSLERTSDPGAMRRRGPHIHLPQFETVHDAIAATPHLRNVLVLPGVTDPSTFPETTALLYREWRRDRYQPGRGVSLPSITRIDDDQMHGLIWWQLSRLELPAVRSVPEDGLGHIGGVKYLVLGVTSLSEGQVMDLGDLFDLKRVWLPNLDPVPDYVPRRGRFRIGAPRSRAPRTYCGASLQRKDDRSLTRCSEAAKETLRGARQGGPGLILGVHGPLDEELARLIVARNPSKVKLFAVTSIGEEAADVLAAYPSPLTIHGPRTLPRPVAERFATFSSSLVRLPETRLPPDVKVDAIARQNRLWDIDGSRWTAAMAQILVDRAGKGRLEVPTSRPVLTAPACRVLAGFDGRELALRVHHAKCARELANAKADRLTVRVEDTEEVGLGRYLTAFSGHELDIEPAWGVDEEASIAGILGADVDTVRVSRRIPPSVRLWAGRRVILDLGLGNAHWIVSEPRAEVLRIDATSTIRQPEFSEGDAEYYARFGLGLELYGFRVSREARAVLQASPTLKFVRIRRAGPRPAAGASP